MLKIFFSVCLVMLMTIGHTTAQQANKASIDSMHAYFEMHFNDPTNPIVLTAADTLLQMAHKLNDTVMTKLALGAKLDYYYYGQGTNRTDSVIAWVSRIQHYARSVDNLELYYWVWSARLVNYYIKQGEYNIALIEAEKMLVSAEKDKSMSSIAECYSALANIYGAKGMMKKSLEFMLKEIELYEKYKFTRYHITFQYSDAAKIYIDLGEKEKAPELLQKALKESKSTYHTVAAKLVYISLYLAENNIPAAQKALDECRQIYKEEPSLKRHIHYLYDAEIDFYKQTGDYNAALHIINEREKELKKNEDVVSLATLNKTKADILWSLNRKEEAAVLYRELIDEQKKERERNEEITTGEFATLLNLHQLNTEKRQLEKVSQEKALQNIRIILFFLIGILCLVIVFLYQQGKLNRKLKRSRDKLDQKNRILIEAERELRIAKEAAEQSSWMKSVFIQNMSHEIRTPLNSIVGFSAVLSDYMKGNEEVKQYANLIETNSNLLLKLISDILDISILDNESVINRSDIDVNSCCYSAMDANQSSFSPDVNVIFQPQCEELIINSNYERIVQVLDNLLNNAAKFTSKGSVTLAYEINKKENRVVFTITDTGIGIPHEKQEHVFERFVKLDDFSQGTGLGLAISRIIAEKLGGYLIIDREYTQGTRFIFSVGM